MSALGVGLRRKRTRHLIELGGLVVKSGVVDLTGDDRAIVSGALIWMADNSSSMTAKRPMRSGPTRGNRRSTPNAKASFHRLAGTA
jgi:hypothetical protein